MAPTINGFAVAYTVAGAIVLWSGIVGEPISQTFHDILSGKKPAGGTQGIVNSAQTLPGDTTTNVDPTIGSATQAIGTPGTGTGSPTGAIELANQASGKLLAAYYGWATGAQWTALNNVVMSESGWNNTAQNPGSTAYGIGQFLDTTWATVGYSKTSDPVTQITAMLAYIKQRYGTPEAAWNFHLSNGYY